MFFSYLTSPSGGVSLLSMSPVYIKPVTLPDETSSMMLEIEALSDSGLRSFDTRNATLEFWGNKLRCEKANAILVAL